MGMVYQWKSGARFGVDPQVAHECFETIREKNDGKLQPPAIVKAAKGKKSPLHSVFEWDDTIAGQEHRLWQARQLVACLVVIYETEEKESEPIRAYVSLPDDDGERSYCSVPDALSDEEQRKSVFQDALSGLLIWRNKFRGLNEFTKVFMAIDDLQLGLDLENEVQEAGLAEKVIQ